jgi:hypothetical protein
MPRDQVSDSDFANDWEATKFSRCHIKAAFSDSSARCRGSDASGDLITEDFFIRNQAVTLLRFVYGVNGP